MERVGSEETILLDVRVLSATSRDIPKEIEASRFRRDLYYRLNVLPVTIPPLRERREDIPILAEFFIREIAKRLRKPTRNLSYGALGYLKNREWHGNVRELHNILENALVISDDGEITEKELQSGNLRNSEMKRNVDLRTAVQEFKKDFIQQILKKEEWNQTRAARSLGIQRTYLSKLLKEFGLDHQE
jgi:DNA-binding NtrC family response regulator